MRAGLKGKALLRKLEGAFSARAEGVRSPEDRDCCSFCGPGWIQVLRSWKGQGRCISAGVLELQRYFSITAK